MTLEELFKLEKEGWEFISKGLANNHHELKKMVCNNVPTCEFCKETIWAEDRPLHCMQKDALYAKYFMAAFKKKDRLSKKIAKQISKRFESLIAALL